MACVILANGCSRRTRGGFGFIDVWAFYTRIACTVTFGRAGARSGLECTVVSVIGSYDCFIWTFDAFVTEAMWLVFAVFCRTRFVVFVHGIGATFLARTIETVIFVVSTLAKTGKAGAWTLYTDIVGVAEWLVGVPSLTDC